MHICPSDMRDKSEGGCCPRFCRSQIVNLPDEGEGGDEDEGEG